MLWWSDSLIAEIQPFSVRGVHGLPLGWVPKVFGHPDYGIPEFDGAVYGVWTYTEERLNALKERCVDYAKAYMFDRPLSGRPDIRQNRPGALLVRTLQ